MHDGSRLLEFLGPKASDKTLDWLKSRNVEVKLNCEVDLSRISSGNKKYVTSSGEVIKADCHFLCIGKPLGSEWLMDTFLRDNLDEFGRLKVDLNMRVKGHKNIFAIGDITNVKVFLLPKFLFLCLEFIIQFCNVSNNPTFNVQYTWMSNTTQNSLLSAHSCCYFSVSLYQCSKNR